MPAGTQVRGTKYDYKVVEILDGFAIPESLDYDPDRSGYLRINGEDVEKYILGTGWLPIAGANNYPTSLVYDLGQLTLGRNGLSDLSVTIDKAALGLGNVEDVALSTWAGSDNITNVGVITDGVWNGMAISPLKGGIPSGGTVGQVIKKLSSTDYDVDWGDEDGVGGGSSAWGDITGTLSDQIDLITALNGKQPIDADLTAIAGLTPSNDDIIQRKAGAWTNRTLAQYKVDLAINNVDNTSDINKPVSTAQAAAIALKQDILVSGTNIKTINGSSILGSGNITISGGTSYTFSDGVVESGGAVSIPTNGITSAKINAGAVNDSKISDVAWAKITGTPTTVAGYGISDAVTLTGTQTITNKTISGANNTLSNIALTALVQGGAALNQVLRWNGSVWAPSDESSGGTSYIFTPADFNNLAGTISIDYTNGQAASGSTKGFLTSADWLSFNGKQNQITTGSTAQYFRGDLSLATFPTNVSTFVNDAGYLVNITGKISAGTNVSITGSGTTASPYVISSTASGLTDGDKGDITVSSSGATWTVDLLAITNAKINDVAWSKITSTPTTVAGYGITDAVTLTGTQTLTNKTLTSPKINVGSDATGDVYFRDGSGNLVRLAIGSTGQVLKVVSGLPAWAADATGGGGGSTLADGDYGDVTVSATGTAIFIDNGAVTNAKLANVATATLKGRVTASTGVVEDLTGTQATTLLDVFTSTLKGLVPLSGGGTLNFLRADGTWAAPSGGTTYTFTASDFNESGTTISIDYSNGQAATTSLKGFLTATDWNTFNSKQNAITTGSTAQYFRGDLSLATFPTNVSAFTNDAAYLQNITGKVTAGTNVSITGSGTTGSPYVINASASGTVTGVSGTTNRITSSGGASPVIDISASYVGQTSITTLGTIATGVWNGSAIGDSYISSAATWNAKLSNITGLVTAGTNVSISGAGTSGSPYVINATGGGTYTGTANRISIAGSVIDIASTYLGQSSITTLGTIASGTWNATPIGTTKGGVPTGGTAGQVLAKINGTDYNTQWIPAPTLELIPGYGILIDGENNISVDPDILTGGGGISELTGDVYASGAGSVVATIQSNAVTTTKIADANVTNAKIASVAWSKITSTPTTVSGYGITDAVTLTGTQTITNKTLTSPKINVGSDATGDIYYRNSSGDLVRLALGSNGQVLKITSGLPAWGTDISGGGGVTDGSYTDITISGTGTVYTIANNAITTAKILDANVTNAKLANSTITHGAPGTSGTAPNWSASSTALGGTATLNIPLASATSVTAGLVSKTNYDAWQAKQEALVSGTNIKTVNGATILGSGDLTIATGITSVAALGSSPNANAATVASNVLTLQPASASYGGVWSTTAQTLPGNKTFTGYRNNFNGHSPRLNANYTPSEVPPSSLVNGKYNGFGFIDVFPDGTLVDIYCESSSHTGQDCVLKMRKSKDQGITWTSSTIATNGSDGIGGAGGGVSPTGRLIIFIWDVANDPLEYTNLRVICSDDQGATWGSPYIIPDNTYDEFNAYGKLQAIGNGELLLSWYGYDGTTFSSYVIKSDDDGLTWGSSIVVEENTTDKYTESSFQYLGGGVIIGLLRSEVTDHKYGQYISTDNGDTWTDQGNVSWGIKGTPAWMNTFVSANGRRKVVAYHRNGTNIQAIYADAVSLINDGTSAWETGTIVTLGSSVSGSGYMTVVHPYEGSLGIGRYYSETSPLTVSDLHYRVVAAPVGSGITINNNGDNRIITGSGSSNTLNGESNLTYDGSNFIIDNSGVNYVHILSGSTSSDESAIYLGQSTTDGEYALAERLSNSLSAYGLNAGTYSIYNGGHDINFSTLYSGSPGEYRKDLYISAAGEVQLKASGYLNFGTTGGSSGYGFRDNAGTLQIKNSGGSWADFGSGGGSNWSVSGSNIYRTSLVGIGAAPEAGVDLHVNQTTSATVWITGGTGSGHSTGLAFTEGVTGSGGTYAGFGRFSNAHATMPGWFVQYNVGNEILLSTGYSSAYRQDLFINSSGVVAIGALKVTGGTPGVGKVLTSDADGDASWEDATGGSSQWDDVTGGINYTDKVGIQNTAPNYTLDIQGSGDAAGAIDTSGEGTFYGYSMHGAGLLLGVSALGNGVISAAPTNSDLLFTVWNGTGNKETARITAGGAFRVNNTYTLPSTGGSAGQVLQWPGSGSTLAWTTLGGGSGTVTSVGVSGGSTGLTTSGGPITTTGTITLAGTLIAANGGTGQSSYTTGDILYASSSSALSKLSAGTSSYVLTSNGAGSAPSWQPLPGGGQDATYTVLTAVTTNTTETAMTGSMPISNGEAGTLEITVYAVNSTNTGSWTRKLIVPYRGTSGTAAVFETHTNLNGAHAEGSGMADCDISYTYNGSGDFIMSVFGTGSTAIQWRAEIKKYSVFWSA